MSDYKETKPEANDLLSYKLEFEVHDENTPDLTSTNYLAMNEPESAISSPGQATGEKQNLNPSEELGCASGESETFPEDDSQTSGINPSLLLNSDDEEFAEELLANISGESSQNAASKTLESKGLKVILCHVCRKEFTTKRSLLIHMQCHKYSYLPKLCNICGKSCQNLTMLTQHCAVHFRKNSQSHFTCEFCDCSFVYKKDFISHMLFFQHKENRIYKCNVCGGFFMKEIDLNAHMKTHKDKTKYFHCEECGERFKRKRELNHHMVTHIGEKNYDCDKCEKSFKSKLVLTKHLEVMHSGELVCSICKLTFSKKDKKNYNIHMKLH